MGCETALHLAEEGKAVTVIEMAPEIAMETTPAHRRGIKVRMGLCPEEAGGRATQPGLVSPVLMTSTRCKAITPQGVVVAGPDGAERLVEADTVISALGLRSRSNLVEELRMCKHTFITIGDCVQPRQVNQAVRGGYDAAMNLG